MSELDLSFLSLEEAQTIREVLERAKAHEHHLKQDEKGQLEILHISSDDFIRERWSSYSVVSEGNYISAPEMVLAALEDQSKTNNRKASSAEIFQKRPSQNEEIRNLFDNVPIISSAIESLIDDTDDDSTENNKSDLTKSNEQQPASGIDEKTLTLLELAASSKPATDQAGEDEVEINRQANTLTNDFTANTNLTGNLTVEPTEKTTSNAQNKEDATNQTKKSGSNGSEKSTMRPRSSHKEFVGNLSVSLTFYPPSAAADTKFPSRGTRFEDNSNLDVLTRREYVVMTGNKLSLLKDNKCGARAFQDGELHVVVNKATDLCLPDAVTKNKSRTYIKCYMLPDRYHGSKMRSEMVKETANPNYNHKFVFRGFTKEEFMQRSIELVIGGISSNRMATTTVVGVAILSDGKKELTDKKIYWKNSTSSEIDLWNNAFAEPTKEITAVLQLTPKSKRH